MRRKKQKKTSLFDKPVLVRFTKEMNAVICVYAKKFGKTRNQIVRDAVEQYLGVSNGK